MGDWTVFRTGGGAERDATGDLTLDRAFALMLALAGFHWSILGSESGGFRLALVRKGPRLKPPIGNPLTISEFSAPILSHSDDRRTAEREIKLEVLMRGCDGAEAQFDPPAGTEIEFNGVVLRPAASVGQGETEAAV